MTIDISTTDDLSKPNSVTNSNNLNNHNKNNNNNNNKNNNNNNNNTATSTPSSNTNTNKSNESNSKDRKTRQNDRKKRAKERAKQKMQRNTTSNNKKNKFQNKRKDTRTIAVHIVSTEETAESAVKHLVKQKYIGFDCEGVGTLDRNGKIGLIQLSSYTDVYIIDLVSMNYKMPKCLVKFLNGKPKMKQNSKMFVNFNYKKNENKKKNKNNNNGIIKLQRRRTTTNTAMKIAKNEGEKKEIEQIESNDNKGENEKKSWKEIAAIKSKGGKCDNKIKKHNEKNVSNKTVDIRLTEANAHVQHPHEGNSKIDMEDQKMAKTEKQIDNGNYNENRNENENENKEEEDVKEKEKEKEKGQENDSDSDDDSAQGCIKFIHDARCDQDALFHLYGIELHGIFDTTIANLVRKNRQFHRNIDRLSSLDSVAYSVLVPKQMQNNYKNCKFEYNVNLSFLKSDVQHIKRSKTRYYDNILDYSSGDSDTSSDSEIEYYTNGSGSTHDNSVDVATKNRNNNNKNHNAQNKNKNKNNNSNKNKKKNSNKNNKNGNKRKRKKKKNNTKSDNMITDGIVNTGQKQKFPENSENINLEGETKDKDNQGVDIIDIKTENESNGSDNGNTNSVSDNVSNVSNVSIVNGFVFGAQSNQDSQNIYGASSANIMDDSLIEEITKNLNKRKNNELNNTTSDENKENVENITFAKQSNSNNGNHNNQRKKKTNKKKNTKNIKNKNKNNKQTNNLKSNKHDTNNHDNNMNNQRSTNKTVNKGDSAWDENLCKDEVKDDCINNRIDDCDDDEKEIIVLSSKQEKIKCKKKSRRRKFLLNLFDTKSDMKDVMQKDHHIWMRRPMSRMCLLYAAADAYISLLIGQAFIKRFQTRLIKKTLIVSDKWCKMNAKQISLKKSTARVPSSIVRFIKDDGGDAAYLRNPLRLYPDMIEKAKMKKKEREKMNKKRLKNGQSLSRTVKQSFYFDTSIRQWVCADQFEKESDNVSDSESQPE